MRIQILLNNWNCKHSWLMMHLWAVFIAQKAICIQTTKQAWKNLATEKVRQLLKSDTAHWRRVVRTIWTMSLMRLNASSKRWKSCMPRSGFCSSHQLRVANSHQKWVKQPAKSQSKSVSVWLSLSLFRISWLETGSLSSKRMTRWCRSRSSSRKRWMRIESTYNRV